MTRNAVTDRYLAEIARCGLGAEDLVTAAQRTVDLTPTTYRGRVLRRPAFLDHGERVRVADDLRLLHDTLIALPDRLFDGDLGAFARACGMAEVQVTAIVRGRGRAPGRMSRADLYHDGTGFQLMELNIGSALGGLDNAVLNRGFLAHPMLAEFAAANHLSYVDSFAAAVRTLLAETGTPPGQRPFVAMVDTPTSFVELEPLIRTVAQEMSALGLDMVPGHLGQLAVRDGHVWLDDRPADIVFRLFLMEDLLDPETRALIDPVLGAVERGDVVLYVPMDTELYGSKAALAMLSDEANRDRFTATELATLDRLLPWTRMVRDAPVTVAGERVDLFEYALGERENLVLKPTMMHAGIGVVLGWQVERDEWLASLHKAADGPYVLQRRIRGVAEPYPAPGGGTEEMLLKWGVFMGSEGYAGALVGGATDLSGSVLNSITGSTLGCCFHEEDPL